MKYSTLLILLGLISVLFSLILFFYFNPYLNFIFLFLSIITIILGFIWKREADLTTNLNLSENRIQHNQIFEKIEESEIKVSNKIEKIRKSEVTETKLTQLMGRVSIELQKEKFSKELLLRKIDAPIYCLLFHKTEEANLKNAKLKSLRDDILPSLGFRFIHGSRGVYILPPSYLPAFKNKKDIEEWIKKKIIKKIPKNHRYIFSFIVLIDLRFSISIKNDSLTKKRYDTLIEVINPEEILNFSEGLSYLQKKRNMSIRDIINIPNFFFLSDNTSLNAEKREIVKEKNEEIKKAIESELKREIFTEDIPMISSQSLFQAINNYVPVYLEDIEVIKLNAKFWLDLFHRDIK